MFVVPKSDRLAHLLHPHSLTKQLTCLEHPALDDIFDHAEPSGGLEDVAKMVFIDKKPRGDHVQGERLGDVLLYVLEDRGDPRKFRAEHPFFPPDRFE